MKILVDGEVVASGMEGDARCDLLPVLRALANDFSSRRFGLEAGQLVTTGAASVALAEPGQTAVIRFPGIGDAVATLD